MGAKPINSLSKTSRKGRSNNKYTQLERVFLYLKYHKATGAMVCEALNISHKNFCRYKRELEKAGYLWQVVRKQCKVTGYMAWYLTTDLQHYIQSNLFGDDYAA